LRFGVKRVFPLIGASGPSELEKVIGKDLVHSVSVEPCFFTPESLFQSLKKLTIFFAWGCHDVAFLTFVWPGVSAQPTLRQRLLVPRNVRR